jgi:hypothetical protein
MHPSLSPTQGSVARGFSRLGASLILLLVGCWGIAILALDMPDIIRQIARPCAGCYLGAFAPPLEPYGHPARRREDTALAGTTAPPAMTVEPLSTGSGDLHWLALNDAISADQISLFGANPVSEGTVTFLAPNMARALSTGDTGFLYAVVPGQPEPGTIRDGSIDPTARNPWNAAANWGFSQNRFVIESIPRAATSTARASMSPAQGVGANWTDPRQTNILGYRGREPDMFNASGVISADSPLSAQESIPYWRVAVQKDLERHFLQIGTYRMNAGDSQRSGNTGMFSGTGAGADYQFIVDPGGAVSDVLSAHATVIHQERSPDAGYRVMSGSGSDSFNTFLADASWSIGQTVTPSIQYFQTVGSSDAIQYYWPGGRRNSAGVIAGIAYTPWADLESPVHFLNLRFAAQYIAYKEFNGTPHGASANNALFLSLWGALRF